MKKPHKHAELIKAWADGAQIQYLCNRRWHDCSNNTPMWDLATNYRIKPEPRPDVVAVGIVALSDTFKRGMESLAEYKTEFRVSEHWEKDNVRFTFDGETLQLKKAEVL